MEIKVYHSLPKQAAELRQEVFVDEQHFCEEFDQNDQNAIHFVMLDGDEAVATCRIVIEGEIYHIGRVAVRRSRRGGGLGRQIIEAAENHIRTLGGKSILIGAQTQAQGFYAALGYTARGEVYLDEHCEHIEMVKTL